MSELLLTIFRESWHVLQETAGYCLFGIFVAGLLRAFIADDFVLRHLGKNNTASVIKASLIGMPLPLCSCGVIPVAGGLRRQGAGRGPTTAFLISTPETGVDSIAVTWALLDPIMTFMRPLAACVTATLAGIAVNMVPERNGQPQQAAGSCSCGCSCKSETSPPTACPHHAATLSGRVRHGLAFAFGDLLGDIGPSLLLGILAAGAIAAALPEGFIERHLGAGIVPMLVMLVMGVPLYVCATASTPIVAALALKGLSPGAALVFLLAGPATNIATIMVVARLMGKRIAVVYVAVIAAVALLLGLGVNAVYGMASVSVTGWITQEHFEGSSPLAAVLAILLIVLILRAKAPSFFKK